jgi:hypothetical protein
MFFEFMTARTGRSMEWWFEQFKARILTILYPRVMREIGYCVDERTYRAREGGGERGVLASGY